MINVSDDNKAMCCGCGACADVCPRKCLEMKTDKEGFLYPNVDEANCVNCGMCDIVCPIANVKKEKTSCDSEPIAIGGWLKDEDTRKDSSSGGAFSLFAKYIIKQNGVVYGCGLDEDLYPRHMAATTLDELGKLRGSKYVQSDTREIFVDIKKLLDNGRYVFFVGTPCQTAALDSFLGKKRDNLYKCDFICHGVPSPQVFKDYIKYLEEKYDDKVVGFRFRNKDRKWNSSGMQMGTRVFFARKEEKSFAPAFKDPYMNGFLDDVYLRPSCYECSFKTMPKNYTDFTIADFWGVDDVNKNLNDGKGTSLILIHTEHGKKLFDAISSDFFYEEVEYASAIRRNQSIIKSVEKNSKRENFFEDYEKKEFSKLKSKYMSAIGWAVRKMMKIVFKKQFIRFAMVGVTNTLISYLINVFVLLCLSGQKWNYDYVVANIVAFILSVLWSFYWNNRCVFGKGNKEKNVGRKLLKSYMAYGFTGIILNNILSTVWIKLIGVSKYIAPLLNLAVSVPVNFYLQKLWVFTDKKK
ncbi:MAG: 4Fe-4S dicluster domain-containing protein [Lachnospiraceae bacterium]|nr:4Fe-4S dicluster domain-containing protein [Lachnospiraceae bacterium]